MNKVVLALGASLGALTLAACNAQQEEAGAADTEAAVPAETTEVAPAAIETPAPVEGAEVEAGTAALTETEASGEGATTPAN